jgi:hypothetical protein
VSAQITVDLESLALSSRGTLSGIIYLELQSEHGVLQYPEKNWSDIPVVLLSNWMPALRDLESGSDPRVKCRFMDGPFHFTVSRQPNHVWEIQCGGRPGSWTVVASEFLEGIERSSRKVLAECDQRDLRGADLEVLRTAVEEIRPPAI